MRKSMTSATTLSRRLETDAGNVAFIRNNEVWTYGRLASEVQRLARGFVKRGIRPGDRVALHMGNLSELIVAYHACFRVGAIAAPLNIRFKTAELRSLLQRLRPALYVGQAALYNQVAPIEASTLSSNCRFVVDGTVNDSRVQPWTGLFARGTGSLSGPPWTRMRPRYCSRLPERPDSRNSSLILWQHWQILSSIGVGGCNQRRKCK
jgi:acyl-CoA synthetase (AMP-forming)/AMP-acid ligase II